MSHKAMQQCSRACDELVRSEEAYVGTLSTIVEVFLRPLRAWAGEDDGSNGGVTQAEVRSLFGSVETLLTVNQDLLTALLKVEREIAANTVLSTTERPLKLAHALATELERSAAGPLRLYAPHVQTFSTVCETCRMLVAERTRFAAAVRVLELQPRCIGLTLLALLVNTVQRLPRYVLLLKEITTHAKAIGGHTDAAAQAVNALHEAMQRIQAVTKGVDSRVGDAERRLRAMAVARDVLRRDDLVAPARELVSELRLSRLRTTGGLKKVASTRVERQPYMLYLFSDLLVTTTVGGGQRQHTHMRELPMHILYFVTTELICLPGRPPRACERRQFELAIGAAGIDPRQLHPDDWEASILFVAESSNDGLLLRTDTPDEQRLMQAALLRAVATGHKSAAVSAASTHRQRPHGLERVWSNASSSSSISSATVTPLRSANAHTITAATGRSSLSSVASQSDRTDRTADEELPPSPRSLAASFDAASTASSAGDPPYVSGFIVSDSYNGRNGSRRKSSRSFVAPAPPLAEEIARICVTMPRQDTRALFAFEARIERFARITGVARLAAEAFYLEQPANHASIDTLLAAYYERLQTGAPLELVEIDESDLAPVPAVGLADFEKGVGDEERRVFPAALPIAEGDADVGLDQEVALFAQVTGLSEATATNMVREYKRAGLSADMMVASYFDAGRPRPGPSSSAEAAVASPESTPAPTPTQSTPAATPTPSCPRSPNDEQASEATAGPAAAEARSSGSSSADGVRDRRLVPMVAHRPRVPPPLLLENGSADTTSDDMQVDAAHPDLLEASGDSDQGAEVHVHPAPIPPNPSPVSTSTLQLTFVSEPEGAPSAAAIGSNGAAASAGAQPGADATVASEDPCVGVFCAITGVNRDAARRQIREYRELGLTTSEQMVQAHFDSTECAAEQVVEPQPAGAAGAAEEPAVALTAPAASQPPAAARPPEEPAAAGLGRIETPALSVITPPEDEGSPAMPAMPAMPAPAPGQTINFDQMLGISGEDTAAGTDEHESEPVYPLRVASAATTYSAVETPPVSNVSYRSPGSSGRRPRSSKPTRQSRSSKANAGGGCIVQ